MTNFDCNDIKALLSGLIDDELDGPTRHEAERHLADCKPCRDLVNQAEGLNELVALEAQRHTAPAGLPAQFVDAVLRRTVYAEAYQFAGRRWTSWLGWMAAAACFMLAVSLWFVNRHMSPPPMRTADNREQTGNPNLFAYSSLHVPRSWTFDGYLAPLTPRDQTGDSAATLALSDETTSAIDEQLATVFPVAFTRPDDQGVARPQPISNDDADTLNAVSNLMELLSRADVHGFTEVDRIRRIAEYDNLLPRLAEARGRLSPAERPVVLAAESILLRIVQGPMSLDDLQVVRDTAASMDLSSEVGAISTRAAETASSL